MTIETAVDIPIIDFTPFLNNDSEGKRSVAQAIYHACHTVGFMYLINHGMPLQKIDQAFEQSRHFFTLPLAEKQTIAWSTASSNRGYIGIERERLNEARPGDLKEAFNVGYEISTNDGTGKIQSPLTINRWPAGQDTFKATITDFFACCSTTAQQVFRAFALALDMPEFFIASKHPAWAYTLRLLHYPPLKVLPKPGQMRAGAHSDYGTLTLLFQDTVGGLEVQLADQSWIAAPSVPGAILVNTGDLTQRWSNDVFRSTKHRVVLPQTKQAGCDRYSMAFFCQPHPDTEIDCLPSCQSGDNPPRYAPIKAGEYLLSRLQATY